MMPHGLRYGSDELWDIVEYDYLLVTPYGTVWNCASEASLENGSWCRDLQYRPLVGIIVTDLPADWQKSLIERPRPAELEAEVERLRAMGKCVVESLNELYWIADMPIHTRRDIDILTRFVEQSLATNAAALASPGEEPTAVSANDGSCSSGSSRPVGEAGKKEVGQ